MNVSLESLIRFQTLALFLYISNYFKSLMRASLWKFANFSFDFSRMTNILGHPKIVYRTSNMGQKENQLRTTQGKVEHQYLTRAILTWLCFMLRKQETAVLLIQDCSPLSPIHSEPPNPAVTCMSRQLP